MRTILIPAAVLLLPAFAIGTDKFLDDASLWVPLDGLAISAPPSPTDAEVLAVRHFVRQVERFSGVTLPVRFGESPAGIRLIHVGYRATLSEMFDRQGWMTPLESATPDILNQSYVVGAVGVADAPGVADIVAAGYGGDRSARASLGMGYALGHLLRELDVVKGQWGFRVPRTPEVHRPAVEDRTLYHMVSRYASKGLSLMYFTPEETEAYVDWLVDARYSRVTFWQYADFALYPGNVEGTPGWRAYAQDAARQMRHYFDYARRRGLEVYQMITPAHVKHELFSGNGRLVRQGFAGYGQDGVCWSQAEAQALARAFSQAQMEYFGPMDGYVVWFFDPAGCFCEQCRDNQAELLFRQFTVIDELAQTISPGARLVPCLWPTWCFVEHQLAGYTDEEVKAFVSSFLAKCLERYGARHLTVMDMCEYDHTNLYNGLVDPARFRRSAFLYGATGFHGEAANAYAPLKLRYINAQMDLARRRGVEDGMLYVYFEATNTPSVYAFADSLYTGANVWTDPVRRYAQTQAKGDAIALLVELLEALEAFDYAIDRFVPSAPGSCTSQVDAMLRGVEETTREERAEALRRADDAWKRLADHPRWYGNADWMRGYVLAQHWMLRLGEAPDEAVYSTMWDDFKKEAVSNPVYSDYMTHLINAPFARTHWPKR